MKGYGRAKALHFQLTRRTVEKTISWKEEGTDKH